MAWNSQVQKFPVKDLTVTGVCIVLRQLTMSCRGGGPDLELKGWSNQWNLQRHVEKIICSFLIYQANTYSVSVYVQLSPVALTELLPVLQGTQSLNPHNDYCQHFVDTGHRPQNFIRDVGMSQPVTV